MKIFFLWIVSFLPAADPRTKAIKTLGGMVMSFDTTEHPEGRIDAIEAHAKGLTLCKKYDLRGPEFGVGDLAHFHSMAVRSHAAAQAKVGLQPVHA